MVLAIILAIHALDCLLLPYALPVEQIQLHIEPLLVLLVPVMLVIMMLVLQTVQNSIVSILVLHVLTRFHNVHRALPQLKENYQGQIVSARSATMMMEAMSYAQPAIIVAIDVHLPAQLVHNVLALTLDSCQAAHAPV